MNALEFVLGFIALVVVWFFFGIIGLVVIAVIIAVLMAIPKDKEEKTRDYEKEIDDLIENGYVYDIKTAKWVKEKED
jgi:uncharacterized SAM-binding protein YcdF (DUF218 family)